MVAKAFPNPNPDMTVPVYLARPCPDCHGGEQEYRAGLWLRSGVDPAEAERCQFATFDLSANPGMEPALLAAQHWASGEGKPQLVLRSETKGLGKTHLAIAAARACIERDAEVAYFVVARFLDHLRSTQRPGSEETLESARYRVERCPVVILDDLGAGKITDWAVEQLSTIVNERWRRRLRTLVTTNAPLEELEERTLSRLVDWQTSLVVACEGSDYRMRRRA